MNSQNNLQSDLSQISPINNNKDNSSQFFLYIIFLIVFVFFLISLFRLLCSNLNNTYNEFFNRNEIDVTNIITEFLVNLITNVNGIKLMIIKKTYYKRIKKFRQ